MEDLATLDRKTAREIINSLKGGTTPLDAVGYLDVGRDRWYRGMEYYFEGATDGESKVRFIKGYYGDGKTHLMGMARRFALARNFVVSYASVEDMRLDKFEEVYKRIVRQLETKQGPGGLEAVLRRWKKSASSEAAFALRSLDALDLNFRLAVEGYLMANDPSQEDVIVQWLIGEPVQLRELGINHQLKGADSRDMMRSLSAFLRHIGFAGLVVLLDELDRIQNLTARQRQNCYQVLRELMDNTDGQGGMQGTLFYCAAPPEMFVSDRGFSEYDALRTRMQSALQGAISRQGVDYRGTIIDLEKTPLTPDDFYKMAQQVRAIHAIALNWDAPAAISDEKLRENVGLILGEAGLYSMSMPRLVATSVATMIDLAEQGEPFDVSEILEQSARKVEEARQVSSQKKYED